MVTVGMFWPAELAHGAVRRYRVRLGHRGGEVAAEEAVLVRLVGEVVDVRQGRLGGAEAGATRRSPARAVDDREVHLRVRLGGGLGGRGHVVTDGDDDAAVLAQEVVDVRRVVARRGRREELGHDVVVDGDCGLQPLVGRGVEGPVVDAAGVGDFAGQKAAACIRPCVARIRPHAARSDAWGASNNAQSVKGLPWRPPTAWR